MPFIAIALMAAVVVGGGVSVAAENAEPSDALYQYKVHVNDNVRAGAHATVEEVGSMGTSIKSVLHLEAETQTEAEATSDSPEEDEARVDTSLNANVDGAVRIDL